MHYISFLFVVIIRVRGFDRKLGVGGNF